MPDQIFEGLRAAVAASFLPQFDRDDKTATALAETQADEWLMMDLGLWPESIREDEPPASLGDMNEAAFLQA